MTDVRGKMRALNGFGAIAMMLIVGGVGAEWMAAGHIAWALVMQIPFYGLVALCWGLFTRGKWLASYYLIGIGTGIAFTESLYWFTHGGDVAMQTGAWVAGLLTGAGAHWIFGIPAIVWLTILFAAGPALTLLKWSRETPDGRRGVGDWLLAETEAAPAD